MPWPFVTFSRRDVNTNRIFPLFSVKREKDFESEYVLWPLYSWRKHTLDDYVIQRKAIAFFYIEKRSEVDRFNSRSAKKGKKY